MIGSINLKNDTSNFIQHFLKLMSLRIYVSNIYMVFPFGISYRKAQISLHSYFEILIHYIKKAGNYGEDV